MSTKDRRDELNEIARAAALKAGAVAYCDRHEEILVRKGGKDELAHAYAIGTNVWKEAGHSGSFPEVTEAIDRLVKNAPGRCPNCESDAREP